MLSPKKLLSRLDITSKFIITLLIAMSIIAFLSITVLVSQQKSAFDGLQNSSDRVVEGIFESQKVKAKDALKVKTKNLAAILASIAPAAIAEFELSMLADYATVISQDQDISYVAILGTDGPAMAEVGDKAGLASEQLVDHDVSAEGMALGKVIIGYNYKQLNTDLAEAKRQNEENQLTMTAAKEASLKSSRFSLALSLAGLIIATLIIVYYLFKWIIASRLSQLEDNLRNISEGDGDLRLRVDVNGNDGIDRLGTYFNLFVDKIHSAISRVNDAAIQLTAASQQMASITDESTRAIVDQQSETSQVATAITEMAATVQEVAKNASEAAGAANAADKEATNGKQIVNASINSIHKLSDDVENAAQVISQLKDESDKIGGVLDVIQSIAEQTNLLALNAAIEAARAGDQGRGFAVVADEVRTLAQRTQESTTEIQGMIEQIQHSSVKAVSVMEEGRKQTHTSVSTATEAGSSFETITAAIATINDMSTHIASAAEEQNAVADEISKNINQISQIAERSSDGAKKTEIASTELSSLSEELTTLMTQFKI